MFPAILVNKGCCGHQAISYCSCPDCVCPLRDSRWKRSVTSLRVRGLRTVKLRGVRVRVGEEFERRGGTPRREIKVFERHKADDTFTPIGGLHPCPTHTHTRLQSFPNTHTHTHTHTHTQRQQRSGSEHRGPHHHRFGFRRSPTYLYKLSTFP